MIKPIVFFLLIVTPISYAMDEAKDVFSQQPGFVKKLCIFPLLRMSRSMDLDRNVLGCLMEENKGLQEQLKSLLLQTSSGFEQDRNLLGCLTEENKKSQEQLKCPLLQMSSGIEQDWSLLGCLTQENKKFQEQLKRSLLLMSSGIEQDQNLLDFLAKENKRLQKQLKSLLFRMNSGIELDRNLLRCLRAVNKRFQEQLKCPFFIRDVVNFLANKYKTSDGSIADELRIPGTLEYKKMCKELYRLATVRMTEYDVCPSISALISRGGWLNANYGESGKSILMHSLSHAHRDFVVFLIKQGAYVNARDFFDMTVLRHALNGSCIGCVELLLANGAYPDEHNEVGETFLMLFVKKARRSYVNLFLQYGANPSARSFDGSCVRDCNIIYQKRHIKKIIRSILKLMWTLESHNRNFPKKSKDITVGLCMMPEAIELKKALSIDALLEHYGAISLVEDEWHPLINLIRDSSIMYRLFRYLYRDDFKEGVVGFILPENVDKCLSNT